MVIKALKGNIAELAPQTAHAAAIWIRSGFNLRHSTWQHRILPEWRPVTDPPGDQKPWRRPDGSLLPLQAAESSLQYVYVFSNPTDGWGYASIDELGDSLRRCLDALAACDGVERVAIIQMPYCPEGQPQKPEDDLLAAAEMVTVLRKWSDTRVSNPLTHIYLVDLDGDFENLLATATN